MSRELEGEDFKQMVMRVLEEKDQWAKHVAHNCQKCQQCTCGKHKCKLHPIKINLRPTSSTYHDSYQQRPTIQNQAIKKPSSHQEQSQFIVKSQYRTKYEGNHSKTEGNKPIKGKGNMELGGPNFHNTTYQQTYTPKGFQKRGQIKNLQNFKTGGLRLNTMSSYKDTFKSYRPMETVKPIKRQNNLKIEQDMHFNGVSNYSHDFALNGSKYPTDKCGPNRSYNSTKGVKPKSSYQTDYMKKKGYTCPAAYL